MPTHATGAEAKVEIQKAWRRLSTAATTSTGSGGRLVIAGDLNAATKEDRSHNRRPGDIGLASLLQGVQGLTRQTPRKPTFFVQHRHCDLDHRPPAGAPAGGAAPAMGKARGAGRQESLPQSHHRRARGGRGRRSRVGETAEVGAALRSPGRRAQLSQVPAAVPLRAPAGLPRGPPPATSG
eukprot:2301861-Prymnesium_polylepis.1